MADKRIDQLNASPGFSLDDLFEKERDPSGLKYHEKATLQDLMEWLKPQLNYSVYENLAALKANTLFIDARVYCILGLYVRGDGQARIYYFDILSMSVPDDASVVKPDAIDLVNPGRYLQFSV
jgi:hypothetical protein